MSENARIAPNTVGDGIPAPWLRDFVAEINYLSNNTDRPISAAWADSIKLSRAYNDSFRRHLSRFRSINPEGSPSEAQRRFLSAEQAVLLSEGATEDMGLPPYPDSDAYADPATWVDVYNKINRTFPYGNRYFSYLKKDLATTIPERMVVVRFLNRVLGHLLGEEPVMANCGCGDMSGDRLNYLSGRAKEFSFGPVSVLESADGRVVSEYKSDIFNQITSKPDNTRRVVGLDKEDPRDPVNVAWTRACPTPEEVKSGKWSSLHDRLMSARVPEDWLGFRLADFSSRESVKAVMYAEDRLDGFNVAMALFSWYQGTAQARSRKLSNMRWMLKKTGVGLIADFAKPVKNNIYLKPADRWRSPTVYVDVDGVLHPALVGGDGRFRSVRVLPSLALLAKGGPFEAEVYELLKPGRKEA